MNKYFKYIFCVLLFAAPASADEYSDKVREILELSNTIQPSIEMADSMLESMATQNINQMYQAFLDQGKNISRNDVVELYNSYRKEFIAAFGENVVSLMIEPYRNNFSMEELDELISLMQSPTFQKFTIKMPQLVAASQKAGEQFGLQKGQEIMIRLIQENPKFQ